MNEDGRAPAERFLTTKVDRSVTGLVAQQQCCGPLQARNVLFTRTRTLFLLARTLEVMGFTHAEVYTRVTVCS